MIDITFQQFPKIPRLSREIIVTEKIDGTNGCVAVFNRTDLEGYAPFECPAIPVEGTEFVLLAGSRSRWLTRSDDNHGFGNWVYGNRHELVKLGLGRHYGEWWGSGINRAYGLKNGERYFSLFNVSRWGDEGVFAPDLDRGIARPACCRAVPVLYHGPFDENAVDGALESLKKFGSEAAAGYMNPEGIVVYHTAANQLFKKTLKDDDRAKGESA